MDDLNESLDAVINALSGGTSATDPDIMSGSLSPEPLASLYVVIFTDGVANVSSFPGCTNSALLPYTNTNILKKHLECEYFGCSFYTTNCRC